MDIVSVIAKNLCEWMNKHPRLKTDASVATASGVGKTTIQRIKKGAGNPTLKNISDVARAFGRRPEDLMLAATGDNKADLLTPDFCGEPPAPTYTSLMIELTKIAETIDDRGMHILIDRAEEIAARHPRQKKEAA